MFCPGHQHLAVARWSAPQRGDCFTQHVWRHVYLLAGCQRLLRLSGTCFTTPDTFLKVEMLFEDHEPWKVGTDLFHFKAYLLIKPSSQTAGKQTHNLYQDISKTYCDFNVNLSQVYKQCIQCDHIVSKNIRPASRKIV